ncbi:MAG: Ig-like domain-containing protein [Isosphaeraceae bacterium]|nr:Ig-like domain-containing protein [Isosphaeraceae bacterium]
MNPSHPSRRRRASQMGVESLEGRQLLTGSAGSTFAIVPGTISQNGGTSSFTFTIDPTHFTMPKSGKIVIGIDVATQTGSSLVPYITGVTDAQGHAVAGTTHARYTPGLTRTATSYGNQTSAVLTPLTLAPGNKAETYTVTVKGEKNTSGSYLLGFYLAGDANGDGIVNQSDISTIRQGIGAKASSTTYNFDADANRDGMINRADLAVAERNSGAMTTVSPSISANLDPASDTGVQDRITALQTVHFTGAVTPGATVTFTDSNQNIAPVSTTANASGNYSVVVNLGSGSNTFDVSTTDAFGQKISGTIAPVTYDTNAPTSLITVAPTSSSSSTTTTS